MRNINYLIAVFLFAALPLLCKEINIQKRNSSLQIQVLFFSDFESDNPIISKDIGTLSSNEDGLVDIDLDLIAGELDDSTLYYEIHSPDGLLAPRERYIKSSTPLRREIAPDETGDLAEETALGMRLGWPGEDMYFTGDNLGIGVETPTAQLHTNGTVRFEGIDPDAGDLLQSDALGNATWVSPSTIEDADWVIAGSDIYRASGNVGISATSPTEARLVILDNTESRGLLLKAEPPSTVGEFRQSPQLSFMDSYNFGGSTGSHITDLYTYSTCPGCNRYFVIDNGLTKFNMNSSGVEFELMADIQNWPNLDIKFIGPRVTSGYLDGTDLILDLQGQYWNGSSSTVRSAKIIHQVEGDGRSKLNFRVQSGADQLTITEDGYVGIGTNTPASLLHINSSDGNAWINETGHLVTRNSLDPSGEYWTMAVRDDGTMGIGKGALSSGTYVDSSNDILTVKKDTDNVLQVAADILPDASSTRDLGSPSMRYDHIYATTIHANEIDPIVQIDGEQYVTWMSEGIGIWIETAGTQRLENAKFTIDLKEQPKTSDLWLFYNVVAENSIIPIVTPQDRAYLMAYMEGSKLTVEAISGTSDARFAFLLKGKRKDWAQRPPHEVNLPEDEIADPVNMDLYDKNGNLR